MRRATAAAGSGSPSAWVEQRMHAGDAAVEVRAEVAPAPVVGLLAGGTSAASPIDGRGIDRVEPAEAG